MLDIYIFCLCFGETGFDEPRSVLSDVCSTTLRVLSSSSLTVVLVCVVQGQIPTLSSIAKGRRSVLQSTKTPAVQTLTPRDFSIARNPTNQ